MLQSSFKFTSYSLARREQRETAGVLDATEREFQSIFDSALDGILILDDKGLCLEANPAALALLGARRNELVGQSIQKFHSPVDDFENAWKRFLDRKDEQGEVATHPPGRRPSFRRIHREGELPTWASCCRIARHFPEKTGRSRAPSQR